MFEIVKSAHAAPIDISQVFGPARSFPTVGVFFNVLIPNALLFAGIISFIMVVASGIKIIMHAGAGEGEKASHDKAAFTMAIIGLIIIFGAYSIMQMVSILVGYNFLNPTI